MEQQIGQMFRSVLRRPKSRRLLQTRPIFSNSTDHLVDYFQSSGLERLPSLRKGHLLFTHIYFMDNLDDIHHIFGNLMFGGKIGIKVIQQLLQLSAKTYVSSLSQLISELVGRMYIQNEKKNFDIITSECAKLQKHLESTNITKIDKYISKKLSINGSPSLPTKFSVASQVLFMLDIKHNTMAIIFESDTICIKPSQDTFILTPGVCLLENIYSNHPEWTSIDADYYTNWNFNALKRDAGTFVIDYQSNSVAVGSVKRWNRLVYAVYKQHRKELKEQRLRLLFEGWMKRIWVW
eukprot:440358_1